MKDRLGRLLEKVAVHEDELVLGRKKYRFVATLGVGKSAVSSLYRAVVGDDCVTLKRFQTRGDNQILHSQALDFELASYERMATSGILVPRLRGYDRDSYVLVKDYITGQVQIDLVAASAVESETHRQLFALAGQLRRGGWHVDFYPANFVLSEGQLWCIDYEAHPFNAEWGLIEWGLWYWVNADGIRATLANPEAGVLNYPGTFKPRREGLESQVDELVRRYGKLA